jgi:hypothetical protein
MLAFNQCPFFWSLVENVITCFIDLSVVALLIVIEPVEHVLDQEKEVEGVFFHIFDIFWVHVLAYEKEKEIVQEAN